MIKKTLLFLNFFTFLFLSAQSTFEYQRSWGTYLGPIGSRCYTSVFNGQAVFFDSENNIYTKGSVAPISGYPASYYQQFSLNGGQTFQFGQSAYSTLNFYTKFNSSGTPLYFQYNQYQTNNSGSYTKELMFIDHLNNKYFQYQFDPANAPITITPGTWITSSSQYALAKYDSSDNLIWATYQPSASRIIVDDNQNVYLSGTTFDGQNVSTPGTFQDNYQSMVSNGNSGCGYLVKLNSNGQRMWGTLYPGYSSTIQYYNNSIYLGITAIPSTNQIVIPTTGAFQTVKGNFALININANDGTRIWGTYYANPTGNSSVRKFEVNESGIYILGDETYQSNNPNPNYYGTTGSHKPQITSAMDIFLTKFNHSGGRVWSTYVGGTGYDLAQGSYQPIALSGSDIYICAQVWGVSNTLSTANVHQQTPEQNMSTSTNHIFSKFNSDGILQWTSYYGGTSQSSDEGYNIAIKNSSLYLYGDTVSSSGYTTTGSWQPQYIDPYPAVSPTTKKYMTYLVKFNLKSLNTTETEKRTKLTLSDNPNNGNFILRGELLGKENCIVSIFDLSGKLLYKKELTKTQQNEQHLLLENLLQKGNYIVNLTNTNGILIQNFKMTVK